MVEEKTPISSKKRSVVKSGGQAIPTFAMGCFKLSVGLCKEIETLI